MGRAVLRASMAHDPRIREMWADEAWVAPRIATKRPGATMGIRVASPLAVILASVGPLVFLTEPSDLSNAIATGTIGLLAAGTVIGIAAIMGAQFARSRALWTADRTPGAIVLTMSLGTVVVGAFVIPMIALGVVLPLTLIDVVRGLEPGQDAIGLVLMAILGAFVYGLVGLILFGIPAWFLALPHAYAWVRLMRRRRVAPR